MTFSKKIEQLVLTAMVWDSEGWYKIIWEKNQAVGIWLAKPCPFETGEFLATIVSTKDSKIGGKMVYASETGQWQKFPGNDSSSGACYYMLEGFPPPTCDKSVTKGKKWWQFWKTNNSNTDKDLNIALIQASITGETKKVKILIEKGADVNTADKDGDTPLIKSSEKGNAEISKILIEKGADFNASSNKFSRTPLMKASIYGHIEIAKILIEKGAEINAVDKDGNTALAWATKKGHEGIAELLMTRGSKEGALGSNGDSPHAVPWTAESNDALLQTLSDHDLHALVEAQKSGDGAGFFKGFSKAYGCLEEVQFLTSAPDCRSLLGFQGKKFVQVGMGSFCSILTFGYQGQGSSAFSVFLKSAGFTQTDASSVEAPIILKKDGTTITGNKTEGLIIWNDGTQTAIPKDVVV